MTVDIEVKIVQHRLLLARGANSLELTRAEGELWSAYKATLSGAPSLLRRDWLRQHFGGKVAVYDQRHVLYRLAYNKDGTVKNPAVLGLFSRIDQSALSVSSSYHITRLARKIAFKYNVNINDVLTYIVDNYPGTPEAASKLDFSLFEAPLEPGVTPANGKRYKKEIMRITQEFVKSTGVIKNENDLFGQQLLKDFELTLDLMINEFLQRASKSRQENNKETVVARVDFDWAADTLGLDRRKTGDYGDKLQMDIVKKRFRTAAATVHPDRNPSPDASQAYLDFSKALEILVQYNLKYI